MARPAGEALESVEEGEPQRPGPQARGMGSAVRDAVRMLAHAAGPALLEGWTGLPERVAPLLARDEGMARQLVADPELAVRRLTVLALAGVGQGWAVDLLAAAMADPEPEIRALAAESADRWFARQHPPHAPPPALVERVLGLLRDPCEEVRLCVVGPVVRLGGEAGVQSLVAVCEASDDELMRGEILAALAAAGHRAAVARLARSVQAQGRSTPYLRRILLRLEREGRTGLPAWPDGPGPRAWGDGWAPEQTGAAAGEPGP